MAQPPLHKASPTHQVTAHSVSTKWEGSGDETTLTAARQQTDASRHVVVQSPLTRPAWSKGMQCDASRTVWLWDWYAQSMIVTRQTIDLAYDSYSCSL